MANEEIQKIFLKVFQEMCYSRSVWQIWTAREKEYAECIERLGGVEKPSQCFSIIVESLDQNPEQDFLGKLYMSLELGNHWKGQFFTPYSLCECMAGITINDNLQTLENREWISVNDPACGAGATLVAVANIFRRKKINYQTRVLFTANDIDRVVAQMCYIQLSLLGCAGWVATANTISDPVCGDPLIPDERPGQEFWYTPFYFREEWSMRRQLQIFQNQFRELFTPRDEARIGKITFYFDFEKGEYKCQNS